MSAARAGPLLLTMLETTPPFPQWEGASGRSLHPPGLNFLPTWEAAANSSWKHLTAAQLWTKYSTLDPTEASQQPPITIPNFKPRKLRHRETKSPAPSWKVVANRLSQGDREGGSESRKPHS